MMTKITIYIPDKLLTQATAAAAKADITLNDLIRERLQDMTEEEEHNQASRALDALVTRNRDKARLRMANDQDILALHAALTPGPVAGWLLDWHLICLDVINESPVITRPFLVGIRESTGRERMTSFVLGIDLDRCLAQTENSLYALGNRSNEPLTQERMDFVCAVLNSWGVGQYLGVPSYYLFNGQGRLKV